MPPPEPKLPEVHERRCPSCQGERIAHVGYVLAIEGMIKVQHRCETCTTVFWLVRKAII